MKNKLFVILLIIGFLSVQDAVAQIKIGYTNPNRILSQLPEVEEIEQKIDSLISQRDEELAIKAADLQKIFADYESKKSSLNEAARASREDELLKLNEEFEKERQTYLNEVQQKRNQMLRPIIEEMNQAMEEVAEEMDLDLVLNDGTSYGDSIIFFANSEKLDITSKVVAKLTQS